MTDSISLTEIAWLMTHLPNHYLAIGCERNDDGEAMLSATLMERPPDGGWQSRGHFFRHPKGVSWTVSAGKLAFDNACRCGVTTELDSEKFDQLVRGMVLKEIEISANDPSPDALPREHGLP